MLDVNAAWQAVIARDAMADGEFVFAVRTTGVYCRPSCPARRPRREHVQFFATSTAAEQAGFRACLRCRPSRKWRTDTDRAVAKAVNYLDERVGEAVQLSELARITGVSASHLQRSFTRAVGLSPRAYQASKRAERLKNRLRSGEGVSRAIYEAGFGSSRAAYELAPGVLAMSPAAYKRGGAGERINYMVVPSVFGALLVAATSRGVCAVSLGDSDSGLTEDLHREFPNADLVSGPAGNMQMREWVGSIQRALASGSPMQNVPVELAGSEFQQRVWLALRDIPAGVTRTYGDIARSIGAPGAAIAVGGACAANRVALLVPCHRVVRRDGASGEYRWGTDRKRALLELERSGSG